jgi:hypothetical protein
MIWTGSPGIKWTDKKINVTTPQSRGMVRRKRRRMKTLYRAMGEILDRQ